MEQRSLIEELNQGKELARQLRNHLRPPSDDTILLIEKILGSYEKALSVLGGVDQQHAGVESALAPMNEDCKHKQGSNKKRKVMAKWIEQVKVPSGGAFEGPRDDGFSWRKYGQKDILGSKFPRGYFRCSHRFAQGCLATKKVQKSDDEPTMYEVTYKGRHTCNRVLHSNTPREQKPLLQHLVPPKQERKPLQKLEPSCFNFGADAVRVKSENLDDVDGGLSRPFCAPKPWVRSEVREDDSPFGESMMEGELSPTFESNDLFGLCCVGDEGWDFETGFASVPDVSIGDLEEYCSFDNVELFC